MRRTLNVIGCLIVVFFSVASGAEPARQPNVLFILCDDLRPDVNGERRETPRGYYTTVVTDYALDWLKSRQAGRSWMKLIAGGGDPGWRTEWLYEYNYEKQFPYTPNIRGIRTDRWKFIRYPHGDGSADRHLAELYDLSADPDELVNLAADPAHVATRADLERRLAELLAANGLTAETDTMPLDEGIKSALPDQKIR